MNTLQRLRSASTAMWTGVGMAVVMMTLAAFRIGRSFGYDEGFTYFFFINGGSVRRALTTQIVFNNHPMFSAVQAAAWRLGFVGETPQRLGPAICAAATVGLVAWFVTRRSNWVAGCGAGVILALNPLFLDQARQLRGYALATLMVTAAGLAVYESWTDERQRWLIVQGVCMTVAVSTHSFSAVTLLMFAAASLALGRVERRHLLTWLTAAITTLVIMAPVLDDMRANSASRGTRYISVFPEFLARALTGWEWPVVWSTSLLVLVGSVSICWRSRRHLAGTAAAAGVMVSVVVVLWQIVQPFDLYLRFFISITPIIAVVAGIGLAALPRPAAGGALLVIVALLVPSTRDLLDVEPTVRDAAVVADRARAAGLELCGRNAEPLLVYTAPIRLINGVEDFEECEAYVSVLGMNAAQRDAASARFSGRFDLGGGISIWSDESVIDALTNGL
ncbi:MAG: ArnT family glycosyltransferase [Ilumatobacter sp.]